MKRLLAILLLLSSAAFAAPAFVQKTTGINTVGVTTVVSGSITTTAGNFLLALVGENSFTGMNGCTGQSVTWTLLASNPGGGISTDLYVFYAANIPGATGSVTCTASAGQWMTVEILEYSGVDTTAPIDSFVTCGSDVNVTSAQCGAVTPVWDSQLVVGAWTQGSSATGATADSPYTLRVGSNNANEPTLRLDAEELVMAADPIAKTSSFSTPSAPFRMATLMIKGAGANPLLTPLRRGGVVAQ